MTRYGADVRTTVVTLNLNQGHHLRENVESVANQGLPVRHIVVDPGSTDGSDEAYREPWAAHLIVQRQPDSGPAQGLNNGFRDCPTPYGSFLNADDLLLPRALAALEKALDDGADLVMGRAWLTGPTLRRQRLLIPDRPAPVLLANDVNYVVQPGSAFRMSAYRAAGGFSEDNRVNWDHELYTRIALGSGRTVRLPLPTALFRQYPGTLTSDPDRARLEREANDRLRAACGLRTLPVPVRSLARLISRGSDPRKLLALARARSEREVPG